MPRLGQFPDLLVSNLRRVSFCPVHDATRKRFVLERQPHAGGSFVNGTDLIRRLAVLNIPGDRLRGASLPLKLNCPGFGWGVLFCL